MSGWLLLKTGHKWVGYEFKTSGIYLHYFASGKEKVRDNNYDASAIVSAMHFMKAVKTLLRNQITTVKVSGKQHKGAENCFEVHFLGAPGSPWLLSALSKVTTTTAIANSTYVYIS